MAGIIPDGMSQDLDAAKGMNQRGASAGNDTNFVWFFSLSNEIAGYQAAACYFEPIQASRRFGIVFVKCSGQTQPIKSNIRLMFCFGLFSGQRIHSSFYSTNGDFSRRLVNMTTSLFPNPRTRWPSRRTLLNWGMGVVLAATLGMATAGGKPYGYFITGKVQEMTLAPPTTPSIVLMGGGPDVDEAFRWMITRAGIKPETGGRFVVIRATGTEAYDPYIYYSDAALTTSATVADQWVGGASLGLTSVETLVIPSIKAANDPDVNLIVSKANAVFIAGGDQSDYIKYWKGTKLEQTLQVLMTKNIPMGGTSAGLAVLGQFDFAALNGSVTSTQALSNPYNKYMTLDPAPLSMYGGFLAPAALANTILDSHVDSRDRMGRLISFVARLVAPQVTPGGTTGCAGGILTTGTVSSVAARGIGVSVETALLIQGNGATQPYSARRVTNLSTTTPSAVYFVRPSIAPTTCASGKPLTMRSVEIHKLDDSGATFNLSDWTGLPSYSVDAISGSLTSFPY